MLEVWSCFRKSKKANSPVIWNVLPEPYVIFHEKPYTYAAWCSVEFCQIVWPKWDAFHAFSIISTYSSHPFATLLHWELASTSIHSTFINAPCFGDLSRRASLNKIKSDYSCPRKRKDGMPKKHDPKKRERKRGSHVSRKKKTRDDLREGTIASRSKPHLSIHPLIHLHLLIEIAWLVSPWIISLTLQYMECKYALFWSYLEFHKAL